MWPPTVLLWFSHSDSQSKNSGFFRTRKKGGRGFWGHPQLWQNKSLIQPENKGGKGWFLRIQNLNFEYFTKTIQICSSKCREGGLLRVRVDSWRRAATPHAIGLQPPRTTFFFYLGTLHHRGVWGDWHPYSCSMMQFLKIRYHNRLIMLVFGCRWPWLCWTNSMVHFI